MPVVRVGAHDLAWREAGQGAPALLLHCSLAHSGAFAGLMARLEDRLAMRAMDLPGHGGTGLEPGVNGQDQAVADALGLLRDRAPAHLVGHSFGGTVALRLALEAPALAASLTLIEPVQFSLLAEADPAAFAAETAFQATYMAAAADGDWALAARRFLRRWGDGPAGADPVPSAYAVARMPLVAGEGQTVADPAHARVHVADLARLACPLLLVQGTDSPPVAGAILDVIATAVPHARRLAVAGAGHMVPITRPAPVAEAIAALAATA